MARFEREARLLAALNHPYIAAIYGLEESSGAPALVMELVEGPTLAERIAAGPIPLDEALPIARQIAEALEYAHERGVIHRDLKPANIKAKADGTVKVLDFGLAKALTEDPATVDMSNSPTLSMGATMQGVILGTAAYMSPEQAKAKPADRRADIWAFGVVLYEMLTGRQLYTGETAAETLASVIKEMPDLNQLPASTPPAIRNLITRCLDKDPRQRLQHIGEARIAIERALASPEPDAGSALSSAPAHRGRERIVLAALAGLFLLTTLALIATIYLRRAPEDARSVRFSMEMPDTWALTQRLSVTGGAPEPLAVSPDGRSIAFLATKADGNTQLWVRALDALEARLLAGTEGATAPSWSPDSRFLAFFADGKLKKIDIVGGPPIALCDAPDNRGGTWGRDGTILFSPSNNSPLVKVSSSGGVPSPATVLSAGDIAHLRPSFLPDGRHFLYGSRPRGSGESGPIFVGTLGSNDRKRLFSSDVTNAFYSQGHLLFLREGTLMAQPFDPQRLALSGDAFPIAEHIETQANLAVGVFSASENGVLVYQTGNVSANNQLIWYDRSGKEMGALGEPGRYGYLEFSPDGKRAAVSIFDGARPSIWIYDLARGVPTRFTFGAAATAEPIWSPDGSRIVFNESNNGARDLYQKASDGSGAEAPLLIEKSNKYPQSWSPDGRFILYAVFGVTHPDLLALPLSGDRKPVPFRPGAGGARFSPDGKWVAYSSSESGRPEIYVTPYPGPGGKWQVSNGGGNYPRWRRDGSEIFYLTGDDKLMVAEVNGKGSSFEVGAAKPLFDTAAVQGYGYTYDVTADGQRFLIDTGPEHEVTEPLTVVVNWPAGLKK